MENDAPSRAAIDAVAGTVASPEADEELFAAAKEAI
jgi:hypothetical protein